MVRKKQSFMNQLTGIALLVVGGVLILWGYNESQSLGSHVNRFFSGNPTQNTLYFYIGGGICIALGAVNLLRK